MTFEDFQPVHLLAFTDPFATWSYGEALSQRGPAYTVRHGGIVLCGGIAADEAGQGWLWSFVSPAAGISFLTLHRHVQRFIEVYEQPLIATTPQYGPGCRWLELLGFHRAEPLAGFYPGCPDQYVYRRG